MPACSRPTSIYSTNKFASSTVALVVAGIATFTPASSLAEQYQEVLVTATLTPTVYLESLSADTVLDAQDIAALQPRDLPDILRQIPALDFVDNGGRGSLSSIRVRGTESDHVLYLVDGVRIADASSGATALQSIPVAHIERIEIVRGPRSGLYGADAIGGVVQVFTKSGRDVEGVVAPVLRAEYGSHDARKTQASLLGKSGGFFYRAGLGYEESNGIDRTVGGSGADLDRDGYRETNYAAAAGYAFGEQSRSQRVEMRWTGADGRSEFDSASGSADDYTDFRIGTGSLAYQQPLGDAAKLALTLGHSIDDQRSRGANDFNFETTRDSARLQLDYRIADDSKILLGLDHYRDKVDSSANFVRDARENNAFFIEYLGDFARVNTQLALRLDDNQAYGEEVTGNAALGLKLGAETMLSLSYGSAFKAPTFNDLYFPFTDFGFGFTFQGNPDVAPESSQSVELLLKASSARISGYAAVHHTEIDDLIATTATTVENIDEATITGADAGLRFVIASINVHTGVSYIEAEDANSNQRLLRRPRVSGMLSLDKKIGALDVGIDWNAEGDRLDTGGRLAGYNLLDARATWQVSDALRIGAIVRNVAGNDYTLVKGFQEFRTEGQTASVFVEYAPR